MLWRYATCDMIYNSMVPDFSEITTECLHVHLYLAFCLWMRKMASTSYLICETLLVVLDHRPTRDLAPFNIISPWTGFELTTVVVIGTNCPGSCRSNYHTITIITAPTFLWEYLLIITLCDEVCQRVLGTVSVDEIKHCYYILTISISKFNL
jgi:hypothetical protein